MKEFRTLFPILRHFRWQYIFGTLLLMITSGGQLLIPQIFRQSIDLLVSGSFTLRIIAQSMGTLVAIALSIAICRFGWRFFIQGSAQHIERMLRDKLFAQFTKLSSSFYEKNRTGDLMARATNDMEAVKMACGWGLVTFVDGIFLTTAILIILFVQNPRLAFLVILPFPLIILFMSRTGVIINKLFYQVQEGFSNLTEFSRESISGVRVIKSLVREPYFLKRFAAANEHYQKKNLTYVRFWGLLFPLISLVAGIATLILLRFGGVAVIDGLFSPGEFVATIAYLEMLVWPMIGAGFTVNIFARGAASLARINELLNEKPDITGGRQRKIVHKDLEIAGLSYQYPSKNEEVLSDIHMRIPWGTTVGILGRTGSGKSTLIKCFARMIDPIPKSVFFGGKDIRSYRLDSLRSHFAYVPQDTYLFSATIEENIAFAIPDCAFTEVEKAAADSTIDRDIKQFHKKFHTPIGEKGVTLSGGQKQRIAISRALLIDPDILVLDDALSAVDAESEEKILSAVLNARKGRTNILVSHRVSALARTDLVFVLENGRIIQEGSPKDLQQSEGFFREMYLLQHPQELHS